MDCTSEGQKRLVVWLIARIISYVFYVQRNSMKKIKSLVPSLLEQQTAIQILLLAASLMLFFALGTRELWTQEWRWANISWNMIYSGDFFHPILAGAPYYDKPLLSYWLMIACSYLVGGLNEWALRLPSALAGLLSIWSTYRIGTVVINKKCGLLAGWMLATSYFFIFWARTANADLLNLAGILLAVQWYFENKHKNNFITYFVFACILSVTALFKGLIGVIIPLLVILPDLLTNREWKKHCRWSLLFAVAAATLIYLIPFYISTLSKNPQYQENGLYLVYRENILRYFTPFDHQGPIYLYFIYLPLYLLPWTLFLLPAIYSLPSRWNKINSGSRWAVWSSALVFLFLTCSGSRRNYYVLPLVPFVVLMIADWFTMSSETGTRLKWASYFLVLGFLVSFLSFGVVQPLYYMGGGLRPFAKEVQTSADTVHSWKNWKIVFLDARSKISLYLKPSAPIVLLGQPGTGDNVFEKSWPVIVHPSQNTIFVSRERYLNQLTPYFKNYTVVLEPLSWGDRIFSGKDSDRAVAFIPKG